MLDRDGLDGALQAESEPLRCEEPPPLPPPPALGSAETGELLAIEGAPDLRPPSWRWAGVSLALALGVAAALALTWHGRDRSPTAPTYLHSQPPAITQTATPMSTTEIEMSAREATARTRPRAPAATERMAVDLVLPARFAFNDTRPLGDAAAIGAVAARCRGAIVLTGHADRLGSDRINDEVALGRADAVRAILATYGVDGARVRIASAGARLPVASNESAAGRNQNRRVTLTCSMANPGGEP